MTRASDDSGVPIALACELTGVRRQVRTTWIGRSLVTGRTTGMCSLAEVLDLAWFQELVGSLGFADARLAWPQVADAIREKSHGPLHVVVDLELKHAAVARTDAEIGAAAAHGRLVKVVSLDSRTTEISDAFDRALNTLAATELRRAKRS